MCSVSQRLLWQHASRSDTTTSPRLAAASDRIRPQVPKPGSGPGGGRATPERGAENPRAPLKGGGRGESEGEGETWALQEDAWRVPRRERTTARGWGWKAAMWQRRRSAGCSSGRGRRHGDRGRGQGLVTDGRGRASCIVKRRCWTRGARGRGGGAGGVGHLYCLKSWSDSLKPLLSSMLMPARASSASCRGAAAAAAASPSSRRRGRCCSEPAMGARGSAQGRGEVGSSCCGPARARSPPLPVRSAAGRAAGRGGEGGAATGCGAGDVRAQAAARRRRGGLLSSRPPLLPLPPRHAARAGTEANPFPGVSNPAEPGPERPPPPLPAAPAPGPCGCPHRAPRPAVQGQRGYARGHEPRTLTLSSKRAGPGASGKPERASGLKRARGTPPGKQQERAAREQVAAASARRFRHESLKPHAASTRDPQLHPDPGAAH